MPLTLTSDIPQAALHAINIRSVSIDYSIGTVTIMLDRLDASGNVLSSVQLPLSAAASSAFSTAIKTAIYNQLQNALGVTGTVT